MNRKISSGPDLVGVPEFKQLKEKLVAMIFSRCWGLGIPDEVKECRAKLFPKTVQGKENVGNWRPITIGNILMRLCAKVWDKRMGANVQLDKRQKGFVQVGGSFENVMILLDIIKRQRKKKREYNIPRSGKSL